MTKYLLKLDLKRYSFLFVLTTALNLAGSDITGRVTDERGSGIQSANVVVSALPDTTFVAATATDSGGMFYFKNIVGGNYVVTVSHIGFETIAKACDGSESLEIRLPSHAAELREVSVEAKRIRYRASGYTVDVAGSDIAEGKGSLEMLGFLPLVNYSNGSLTVLSRKPYAVYVDGIKTVNLQQLEAIPASMIKSVDIAYTAGVGEASDATGAVIKIKLIKLSEGGYNGNLSARVEDMPSYGYRGERLTNYIGYNNKKLSVSNSGLFKRNLLVSDEENEITYNGDGSIAKTDERYRNWTKYAYEQLNLTYEFDQRTELRMSALFTHTDDDGKLNTSDVGGNVLSKITTPSRSNSVHAVGIFNRVLNEKGANLEVSADYLYRHYSANKNLFYPIEDNTDWEDTHQNTDLLLVKAETTLPTSVGEITGGVDMQYARHTDLTDYHRSGMAEGGVWTKMDGYRPAAFASYSGQLGNFNVEAGLRMQGNLTRVYSGGVENNKNVWKLCPKFDLMYMINPEKEAMVMLSYKRAVDELPYSVISGFRNYLSPLQYTTGNPAINSPVNDELMLVGNYGIVTLTSGMLRTKDPLYYRTVPSPDDNGVIANIADNGKHETAFLASAEGLLPITRWWKAKLSANYRLYWADMGAYSVSRQYGWNFSINNTFKFSKSVGGTLRANYEPECHFRDMKMGAAWAVSGSAYKTFMNNYLQFLLTVSTRVKGREITDTAPQYMTVYRNMTKPLSLSLKVIWYFRGGKNVKVNDQNKTTQDYHQYDIENGRH